MVSTIDIVKEYVMLDREHKDKNSHWPSEATACLKQLWYKWTGTEPSDPPDCPAGCL